MIDKSYIYYKTMVVTTGAGRAAKDDAASLKRVAGTFEALGCW